MNAIGVGQLPSAGEFIYWTGIAAVAVNAVAGVMESGRKGMDLMGVVIVALATALGGGTVRDLLLDRKVFWIADQNQLAAALLAAIVTFFLVRSIRLPARLFLVPDAIGLALFTVTGTQIALDLGAPWLVASLMGVITGAFGGVLRDVLCNEIPLIFLPGELYASAAWAGALAMIALQAHTRIDHVTAAGIAMTTVFLVRVASMIFRVKLPTFVSRR